MPDGLARRGDINLLMLGDPGTAKSQLLKFVENCAPIGVSERTLKIVLLFIILMLTLLICIEWTVTTIASTDCSVCKW